jgi:hypothetical protein
MLTAAAHPHLIERLVMVEAEIPSRVVRSPGTRPQSRADVRVRHPVDRR